MAAPDIKGDNAETVRRTLVVLALIALALAAWQLRVLLLLAFAAILVAVLLRTMTALVERRTPLSDGWAYGTTVLLIVCLLFAAAWLFGSIIVSQSQQLATDVPAAWDGLKRELRTVEWGRTLLDHVSGTKITGERILRSTGTVAVGLVTVLGYLVLVMFGGFFIGLHPRVYRKGLAHLFPKSRREEAEATIHACGEGLRLWLLGQLFSMAMVGILTGLGLWLAGVPAAFTLGLIAALGEFVPFIGPIISAVPGLLVASAQGFDTLAWAAAVYLAVQQIEGNVVQPLVERRLIALPPALLIFSVVAFGALFGALGMLLAAPLTVVAFIAINKLYVADTLGDRPSSRKLRAMVE